MGVLFSLASRFDIVYWFNFLITFAGFPAAIEWSGISLVTTEPAPMTQPFPMVTPGQMIAFPPIQQSSPIVMGFEILWVRRIIASSGWVAVYNCSARANKAHWSQW